MLSQDASHLQDASFSQPRQASGILTPTSLSSELNDGFGGKKRKRDGNSLEDLLKDKFVVKPFPSKTIARPRSLQPLLLLPRSCLPLSYLDIGSTTNPLPQSRLFEAHVKILELEERMGSQPTILIARLDDNRTLYAIEREDKGLYVVLQLGSWVTLQQLKTVAVVVQIEPSKLNLDAQGGLTALDVSNVPLITPEGNKYNKKKRLAIEAIQSMIRRPSTAITPESQSQLIAPESFSESRDDTQAQVDEIPAKEEATTQVTATEMFENIRIQYFEALYLSKTSLAYFAKGPLSRARAAFHLDFDSTLDMKDHIAFLESLVLSSTLLDKKYRDGLPGCIALLDPHDLSDDDAKPKIKKRKANRKMKPGKNGLYPNEELLISKWWVNRDEEVDSGAPGSSKDEILKARLADLRIRETQLQMIVVLEILALQPLVSSVDNPDEDLPTLPNSTIIETKERTPKKRKLDHLTMLVDVHVDRLCIWQSITSEATRAPDTDSKLTPVAINAAKHVDNVLRDFCIEVIGPFFSARLPERCDAINRKLGGPVIKSASKPRISKSASFSNSRSRPGAVTKRPVPTKPRKSLQRVLSDERERRSISIGSNRAISLMRSVTEPSLPSLKREASEAPSLSNIPIAESKSLHASRGGVLNSKRFFQREVDLSALAPDLSKVKKQAAIEAELRDAISALKKPNRELAGKGLAETAERRSASATHPRKSKKPVRNPLFQGVQPVQIKATPKSNRQKDMFGEPRPPVDIPSSAGTAEMGLVPPSSIPRIPQSDIRPRDQNPFRNMVQATPSRKSISAALANPRNTFDTFVFDSDAIPPSSPLQPRRSSAQMFNSIPDSVVKRDSSSSYSRAMLETPVKRPSTSSPQYDVVETPLNKGSETNINHSHPFTVDFQDKENVTNVPRETAFKSLQSNPSKEDSIYAALGWDDDDDIDELG